MTPLQRQQLQLLLEEQQRLAQAVKGFDERLRHFMAGVEKTVEPEPIAVTDAAHTEREAAERAQLAARIEKALAPAPKPAAPEPVHLPPPLPPTAKPAGTAAPP